MIRAEHKSVSSRCRPYSYNQKSPLEGHYLANLNLTWNPIQTTNSIAKN